MKNPITCSTGLLYKHFDDDDSEYFNKIFDILKNYDFDGFELAFQKFKRLKNFKLSNENLSYLKSLNYNTLHAPCDFLFSGDKKSRELLKKMETIYHLLGAKNIVFHTCFFMKNYDVLKNYNFNYSIENECSSKASFKTIEEIAEFLEKNDSYNFTYDFAHAHSVYGDTLLKMAKDFDSKIIQVHMAKLKDDYHYFIHKSNINNLMDDFKKIINEKAIITSELCIESLDELDLLHKEIEYLRKL
ncbi:MAG: hypothetical protein PHN56_07130 [Candidatus Nanoarchaeia archaeon]|nr:hypothetical protein [Candidatus Nanoarchaeia archaeon]